jgi:hypothetical protein
VEYTIETVQNHIRSPLGYYFCVANESVPVMMHIQSFRFNPAPKLKKDKANSNRVMPTGKPSIKKKETYSESTRILNITRDIEHKGRR